MRLFTLAAVTVGVSLGCTRSPGHGDSANPFYSASTLPYQAPPFDQIHRSHYRPAFEEGMKQRLAEIDSIANLTQPASFANTIEAMERSGALLNRVNKVFNALTQADVDDTLQQIQTETAPKLAANRDEIYLNAKLFSRVKAVYDGRQTAGLDSEQVFLVERYYRDFVRAGALLSESDKTKLRQLNQEESKLTTDFEHKLLAATNAGAVVVTDKAELAGLGDDEIATAAGAAKDQKLEGKWLLPLRNTSQQPVLASLTNRALRRRILEASLSRGMTAGENDTRPIILRLAKLRAERAKLLGFPTHAAYVLDDQMAKTPEAAFKLASDMVPAAKARAHREIAKMQAIIDQEKGGFKLAAWDWSYYAEKVRKAEYDIDESEVKPYFELDRVVRDGVFFAANRLYGLTFKQRTDLPVYHPDVKVYEVFDQGGASIALLYTDYFARPSKSGGAWMDNFVDQSTLLGTKPVVYNVANFTKPAAGQPALLSFDDVGTLFHEFGHALHGMLSNIRYPTISGTNTPRDFVEYPSQFNEHWALEPTVLANYAKHYQSGAPIPTALADKIRRSSTFNQGYATTEYLAATLLDLAWHTRDTTTSSQTAETIEAEALKRFAVDMPEVPPRYRSTYFAHIWDGGYSAGYYAYLWSEVLDADTYQWFEENGGMTKANGERFRNMILSRGGSQDVAKLFRAFRGRDPIVEPLLVQRGLK